MPKGKTILLVDSNAKLRQLRAAILSNLGHIITQAGTLEEARDFWQPKQFHLLVVSVQNQLTAAMEFCEEIKQADPEQLVAFLTSLTTYVSRDSCPDDVIHKEEGPAHFVDKVQELLA